MNGTGVLNIVKNIIEEKSFTFKVNKWIVLKTHDEFSDYGDLDVFVVYDDSYGQSYYYITREIASLASKLTNNLDKYVTIFPIGISDYLENSTQFIKNLKTKEVVI